MNAKMVKKEHVKLFDVIIITDVKFEFIDNCVLLSLKRDEICSLFTAVLLIFIYHSDEQHTI